MIKHLGITLRHLRAFVIVAEQGSFKLAARQLLRTQPAITLAIQQLEETIGLKLLERTTRKVDLTDEGEHFMPIAKRLIRDFDTAITDLHATAERRAGHVAVASIPSVAANLFPGVLQTFSLAYPGISVLMTDVNSREVQRKLIRNEVDMGIASKWKADPSLNFSPLLQDTVQMVCHKDHPLAEQTGPVQWADLKGYRYLDSGLQGVEQTLDLITEPKYEFATTTMLFAMLNANFGITILPSLSMQNQSENLVYRPLVDPVITRVVSIVTRREWTMSPASEAMLETIEETFAQMVAALGQDDIKCLV